MKLAKIDNSTTLLISGNREILFINSERGNVEYKLVLPVKEIAAKKTEEEDAVEDEIEADKPVCQESGKIQHMATSGNGELLAVTTTEDKVLYIYRISAINHSAIQLLSTRETSRTSNALRFSADSEHLLLADKTGDCFVYDCATSFEAPGQWVLGHFSMVLDILSTPNQSHVITCDRDEKIRVTNYPKCHAIETYCLGHTEYVAAIEFLPTHADTTLISISGDKTLRIWNYLLGTETLEFQLPAPALRMAVRKYNQSNHIAVTLFEWDTLVVIYEVAAESGDATEFVCKPISAHNFDGEKDVSSILFDDKGALILATISDEHTARLHKLSLNTSGQYQPFNVDHWNETVAANMPTSKVPFNSDEICLLFKKKFDNIHDYQERKKRRIEEKNKSKRS